MKTIAVFFPFELFGNGGTAAGAELLADAFREMLADNRRETRPMRAAAYQGQVHIREYAFETLADVKLWRRRARRIIRRCLAEGKFLLWISGNHLGALPLYEELGRLDGENVVVQFDAHLDVYNLDDCQTELSHGNFLMHAEEPLPAIVNIGHRDLFLPEEHWKRFFRQAIPAPEFTLHPAPALKLVRGACRKADRVVLDLDCDVLDPAFFPGVLEPQPFGLTPQQLLRIIDAAWSDNVVAVALSEFCPARDVRDQSLATLVWLLEYLLLKKNDG